MRIRYFTYYAFANAPHGFFSLHAICCLVEEFDTKFRVDCYQQEVCVQVLIWEDQRQYIFSAWPWTQFLLY